MTAWSWFSFWSGWIAGVGVGFAFGFRVSSRRQSHRRELFDKLEIK